VAADAPSVKDSWRGLKIGVASYTFRKLKLDDTIKAIQKTGLKYVSIKDFHMPMQMSLPQRQEVVKKFRDAGIEPLSCGNITMPNTEATCRHNFLYVKEVGIPTIVCAPARDALPLLDKLVKEFDVKIAIHNHGPEDKNFPSPYDVWNAVEKLDPRVGLCIDVGHTARCKVDPAEAIIKCAPRLYDVHMKDLVSTEPKAAGTEVGRGVLPVKAMLENLVKIKFTGHVGFEYEIDVDDPLPGLMESVGYVHGVLATMA